MLASFQRHWFLLGLVSVLVVGIVWSTTMRPFVSWLPSSLIVAAVTWMMALSLETRTLWHSIRRPGPAWLAVALNSGIAPPLGWLASRGLPQELAAGVIVAATVPCTLASAAVWTRRAGGNDAVAFLVTMITNLTCFIFVPAWLKLLVGLPTDVDYEGVNYGKILVALLLIVVLPIVFAQLMRQWRPLGDWATRHKGQLSLGAQIGILVMVFLGAIECGERLQAVTGDTILTARNLIMMVAAVVAVHMALLLLGFYLSRVCRMPPEEAVAVAFAGSQKTLMIGVFLTVAVGPLAILPMVTYHAAQLLIDTLVADWYRERLISSPGVD